MSRNVVTDSYLIAYPLCCTSLSLWYYGMMRKVKVWGGTHPDERKPMELADSLTLYPVPNVSAGIANIRARQLGRRMVHMNLNGAYPGKRLSFTYEIRRAPSILRGSKGFFAVADVHGNPHHGEDTVYIGGRGVSREVLGFIGELGIRRLVLTSHNSLPEHVDNCFLPDLLETSHRSDIGYLRDAFDYLANTEKLPEAETKAFEWYAHLGNVTTERADPACLPQDIRGFEKVPQAIAVQMSHSELPVHVLSWTGSANSAGYWAELCTPIPPPDDSLWPR